MNVKQQAHLLVFKAMKAGKINREPCSICGNKVSLAHHEDYSRPFFLTWLCGVHHRSRHKILGYWDAKAGGWKSKKEASRLGALKMWERRKKERTLPAKKFIPGAFRLKNLA